jgi:hypothetical protein
VNFCMKSSNQNNKTDIIKNLKKGIETKNIDLITEGLGQLRKIDPDNWLSEIFLSKVLNISPLKVEFSETLEIIISATNKAHEKHLLTASDHDRLLLPLTDIHDCFIALVKNLEKLDVWEIPAAKTIYRFSAFSEDQSQIANNQIENQIRSRGYFDSSILLENNVETMFGGVKANYPHVYEENCENLELILYYSMHRFKSNFYGEIDTIRSPYNDIEFSKLNGYATTWRSLKRLWEDVKYRNWKPTTPYYNNLNIRVYMPENREEYLRCVTGWIRIDQYRTERQYNQLIKKSAITKNDVTDYINELSKTINTPNFNQSWDGQIDLNLLKKATNQINEFYEDELSTRGFYYEQLLSEAVLYSPKKPITWEKYWHINKVLKILANVFHDAAENQKLGIDEGSEFRKIILVDEIVLAKTIHEFTGIETENCHDALCALTYNPEFSELEIWDTPLIKIDSQRILIVPEIIRMGSPIRAAENIISQWNQPLLDKRGKLLEKDLHEFFSKQKGIYAQPLTFKTNDGSNIECDLVIYWEGYLLLIEAKCTKQIFTSADFYRAKNRVKDAIKQLKIRKDAILQNWDNFRKSASNLGLPNQVIPSENLKLIAISNVMEFTEWIERDVIVTDEFCIRRFFGSAEIEMIGITSDGAKKMGTLGRIRTRDEPSVGEFLTYLRRPPQVEAVRKALEEKIIWLPNIEDQRITIGVFDAVYNPILNPATKFREKILKSKKISRRKRRAT